jgi:hypothetical protein
MSAVIVSFGGPKAQPKPWQNHELAELYRAVEILGRAGLALETDMGVSDEGEPWFVFCRADTGDVIVHCARIDGQFAVSSVAMSETLRGTNFRKVIDAIVRHQPLSLPVRQNGSQLFLHPAVIFTAFVATALLVSQKADAHDLKSAIQVALHDQPPASPAPKGLPGLRAAISDLLTAITTGGAAAQPDAMLGGWGGAVNLTHITNAAYAMVLPSAFMLIGEHAGEAASLASLSPALTGLNEGSGFLPADFSAAARPAAVAEPDGAAPSGDVPVSGTLQALPQSVIGGEKFAAAADAALETPHQTITVKPISFNGATEQGVVSVDHTAHAIIAVPPPGAGQAGEPVSLTSLQHILVDANQAAELAMISPDAMIVFFGVSQANAWQAATNFAGEVVVAAATKLGVAVQPDVKNFDQAAPVADTNNAPVPAPVHDAAVTQDNAAPPPAPDAPQPAPAPAENEAPNPNPPNANINDQQAAAVDNAPPAAPVFATAADLAAPVQPIGPPLPADNAGAATIDIPKDPAGALAQLLNYALSSHPITGPLMPTTQLITGLQAYTEQVNGPVHVVVFDSQNVTQSFFNFVQGVLFVNDHQLGLTATSTTATTMVDLMNGGEIKLLGVIDAAQLLHIV